MYAHMHQWHGWAQAQPIMSSAQPIFMVYCAINLCTFPHKNTINGLYNTQITHFEFIVVVCVAYF